MTRNASTSVLSEPQTFRIEKVVAGGLGLARTDGEGVVLLQGALEGETVRAAVQARGGVRRGQVTEVLEASPDRANDAPDLPTADLAHAHYEAQLRYKRGFVQEALARIARIDGVAVAPTVPSPAQWHYRSAAQYLITPQGPAYRQRRSDRPRLLEEADPLVMPVISGLLERADMRELSGVQEVALRASTLTGDIVVALIAAGEPRQLLAAADHLMDCGASGVSLARPAGRRFSAGVRLLTGEAELPERIGDAELTVSATGFAQVNPPAAALAYAEVARLAAYAREWATAEEGTGDAETRGHAADLYGGAGAIAQHLEGHFARVSVIDTDAEGLSRGRQAAAELGLSSLDFIQGDASVLESLGIDVLVIDPPRAGMDDEARRFVHESTAERIVYMSCDPATWARDVGDLVRVGWSLGEVTPFDFYPQTSHVELVSVLER